MQRITATDNPFLTSFLTRIITSSRRNNNAFSVMVVVAAEEEEELVVVVGSIDGLGDKLYNYF